MGHLTCDTWWGGGMNILSKFQLPKVKSVKREKCCSGKRPLRLTFTTPLFASMASLGSLDFLACYITGKKCQITLTPLHYTTLEYTLVDYITVV